VQILRKLIDSIPPLPVRDVCIGLNNVAVKSRYLGLATTLSNNVNELPLCDKNKELTDLSSSDLARFALSDELLKASVGMAAINSALERYNDKIREINAKDILSDKGKNRSVAVIGHFPFVDAAHGFKRLFVFEKQPHPGDYTEADIPQYLPEAELVAISSTTLTNHSLANILKYVHENAFVLLVGPTTPISPVLFDYCIDALCGIYCEDEKLIFQQVKEATPNRYLKSRKYVTLLKEDFL